MKCADHSFVSFLVDQRANAHLISNILFKIFTLLLSGILQAALQEGGGGEQSVSSVDHTGRLLALLQRVFLPRGPALSSGERTNGS